MNELALPGVRCDSLLGYLKGLALLRILRQDCKLRWDGSVAVFVSKLQLNELLARLVDDYKPTPILNPWNNGAGFDEQSITKAAGIAVSRVASQSSSRWSAYREAIAAARDVLAAMGAGDDDDRKLRLLVRLRARFSDAALEWLDAAVAIGIEKENLRAFFPPLLGSGGNDGRLDFSKNFMERALDVIGDDAKRSVSEAWLRDALLGSAAAALKENVAIGQFAPGFAGGFNASTDFESRSLVNPWDYVLAMEGAVMFPTALAKRTASRSARATYPFSFSAVTSGYASGSDEPTRGELWLPVWKGAATFANARALMRGARLEIDTSSGERSGSRPATNALEAVIAVRAQGVALGLERFERVVIAQRNGLAFSATRVGAVVLTQSGVPDAGMALIGRNALRWLGSIRGTELGAAATQALRNFDEAIFRCATIQSGKRAESARALQQVLVSLFKLDAAIAQVAPKGLHPLPFIPADIDAALDDGSSEYRIARALASTGHLRREFRLRYELAAIAPGHHDSGDSYHASKRIAQGRGPLETLAAIFERRIRRAFANEGRALLEGAIGVDAGDFVTFLDHATRRVALQRLFDLTCGFSLVEPLRTVVFSQTYAADERLPVVLAALKLAIDGVGAGFSDPVLDPAIVVSLIARREDKALNNLYRRFQNAAIPIRDFRNSSIDPLPLTVAASIPSDPSARVAFRRVALRPSQFQKERVS